MAVTPLTRVQQATVLALIEARRWRDPRGVVQLM